MPFLCSSSECVPLSTTLPAWTTKILSAFWIVLRFRVQCRSCFVEKQDLRVAEESSCDGYSLSLAAGELHALVAKRGVVAFWKRRDEALDVGVSASPCDPLFGHFFVEREAHEQVLANGAGEQYRLLSHNGKLRAQGLGIHIFEIGTVHHDGSRGRVVEVADKRNETTSGYIQIHTIEDYSRTTRVGEVDILELDMALQLFVTDLLLKDRLVRAVIAQQANKPLRRNLRLGDIGTEAEEVGCGLRAKDDCSKADEELLRPVLSTSDEATSVPEDQGEDKELRRLRDGEEE
ncbi:hypothetical protein KC323_g224 [Hortaea werneckii]|nr:hypothetical protein KC323_g224 [Hortaea werneckii]